MRAPFTGRAGIVTLSAGAFVNAGTPIVTVQQLDPVYIDFTVPQRELGQVHPGQHGALQNHHGSHHQQCDAEHRARHEGQQHLQAQAIQPGHLRGVHNQGL